ncbi:MAG: dihydropteroate synthase [Actinomycetota bacterium]
MIKHARGELSTQHCLVMGIVNRTPDSFFDGGRMDLAEAVTYALELVEEGADILDVGGVKAGPGEVVPHEEEAARVVPLIGELAGAAGVPISVETADPAVAEAAIEAGASILNDVSALADESLARVCADTSASLVIMHHGGQVRGRPRHPRYDDVVVAVIEEFERCAGIATAAGVVEEQLIVDPGLDFGKTTYHSLEIVRRLSELTALDWPVLVAPSRKDVVGESLGLEPDERLEGTLALVTMSVAAGASVVRVHDVKPAVRAVRMAEAVLGRRAPIDPVRGLWD